MEQLPAFDAYGLELSTEPVRVADPTGTPSGRRDAGAPSGVALHVDWRRGC